MQLRAGESQVRYSFQVPFNLAFLFAAMLLSVFLFYWCCVIFFMWTAFSLYCTPSSLAVSCSSMQCRGSNLMLGNVTAQPTSAGCNVTSCTYGGYVNGTILTTWVTVLISFMFPPSCEFILLTWFCQSINFILWLCRLSTSLQPRCPGKNWLTTAISHHYKFVLGLHMFLFSKFF